MLVSEDSRGESIKEMKDTLGLKMTNFWLYVAGLNRFHSEMASYASLVLFFSFESA